ncbi:MAG: hypothetical protein AAF725_22335 [Acidobacteriota bacterium]
MLKKLALLACLSTFAAAPAIAEPWCNQGTIWSFHSGQTGYYFTCNSSTNNSGPAYDYAEAQCAAAWDQVDHLVDDTYFNVKLSVGPGYPWDPQSSQWYYSCRVCITEGYPPAWADEVQHELSLSAGEAGDIGGGLVGGVVVGVELKELGAQDGAKFYVDVLKGSEKVQVIVNARTGKASLPQEGRPGSCQN